MPEALIVAAARTPIGRARKGSLIDVRPDDLAAFAIRSALDQVPELDESEIVDVMVGCGFPQDRQGMNLARRAALLAQLPETVPGTTVNRFCASSLQTIRMAFHAVRADEGDALAIVELLPIVLQQRREQLGLHHSIHWRIAIFAMKGVDAGDTRQREQGLELQRYIRFDQRLSRP